MRSIAMTYRAIALLAVTLGCGCECAPARSKPWRHAPDPDEVAARQPSSATVAAEAENLDTKRRRSHTLRIHVDSRPRHLNPMISPSVWTLRVAADTIFETLIRYEPPEKGAGSGPGHYRPGLAQAWHISQGGREIRIELEPDVRFHDGARMTSVDVQFSLDAARSPRLSAPHLRAQLGDVTAVELVNARTLRIRLARPNGYVLRALAQVPILPAHVYQRKLSAEPGPVVGTGPYRLESWNENAIRLTRYDGYFGQKPAIADIEFFYEPDAARALTAAKRGDFDIIPALIAAHYPDQAAAPGLTSTFVPLRLRPTQFEYLLMDAGEPPLDDARIRQALALLIDRKLATEKIYRGLARPVAGPIWPGGPGDGAAPAPPENDEARAARLLDAAGWHLDGKDGIRQQNGKRLQLALLVLDTPDPPHAELRELLVRTLRRAGVLVEQRAGSAAVLGNRLHSGQFDLALVRWSGEVDQDLAPLLETGGVQNFGRFSSRKVDSALAELRAAWEPAARAPLVGQLARAIAETWPMAPIARPDPYGLLHRRVRGAVVWNGWLALRDLSFAPDEE
jgi:peptide/nickel transport system substrate-binding protein